VALPEPKSGDITDLAALLDLEPLDRDLFRGRNGNHGQPRYSLYGGQVAAQALRAASLTVAEDRMPHSLHGYFLRAGRPDHPVIFAVDRDRDGGSFSARHVRAMQHGEVIFSMLASFKVDEESGEFDSQPGRDAPPPDDLERGGWDALIEARLITVNEIAGHTVTDHFWARVPAPFPDDPVLHTCALTYISDNGSGFGLVQVPGLPPGGPSIDHVLWFHQPIRVDDWVRVDIRPARASGARGTYLGTLRDRDGSLGAVVGQEMLMRMPRGTTAPGTMAPGTMAPGTMAP
jgi:acyl-CoA thioesterase-2